MTFELHVQHSRTFYTHGQKSSSREDVTQMSDPLSCPGRSPWYFPLLCVFIIYIECVLSEKDIVPVAGRRGTREEATWGPGLTLLRFPTPLRPTVLPAGAGGGGPQALRGPEAGAHGD